MRQPTKSAPRAAAVAEPSRVGLTCAIAWLVPGAGHLMQGQIRKAAIFFVVLTFMFVIGLACGGRLFPFQTAEPLAFLAAVAEWAVAVPRAIAALAGFGLGSITAATYEYGNSFLIVGGLLNMLVILDAFDFATGRKTR
jgi:hypothetical protein